MKITELLEGLRLEDFIDDTTDGMKINYDLAEDIMHFMNNNDEAYRRYLYPMIIKCNKLYKTNKSFEPQMFKPAVLSSYALYVDEYPIRELPEKLDVKVCNLVCEKLHEAIMADIKNKKY